jgi:hypothetical protein
LTVPVNVAEFVVMFVADPVVAVGAAPTALNVAVQVLSLSMVIVQVELAPQLEQSAPQPEKIEPEDGVAVRVTFVPEG